MRRFGPHPPVHESVFHRQVPSLVQSAPLGDQPKDTQHRLKCANSPPPLRPSLVAGRRCGTESPELSAKTIGVCAFKKGVFFGGRMANVGRERISAGCVTEPWQEFGISVNSSVHNPGNLLYSAPRAECYTPRPWWTRPDLTRPLCRQFGSAYGWLLF